MKAKKLLHSLTAIFCCLTMSLNVGCAPGIEGSLPSAKPNTNGQESTGASALPGTSVQTTASATAEPSASVQATASATAEPSASVQATASATAEPSASVQATASATAEPSASVQVTASATEKAPDNTSFADLVDFIVDVPAGRDPVVLMLSDPQLIDAAQQRSDDRLGGLSERYSRANIEDRVLRYIREAVSTSNPDLILIAGDVIYGEFDDSGYALSLFVETMESFNIPWAPVMGNHEAETAKGIDWVCQQYESAQNCLFKQRAITGNGNYTIGITQGGKLLRTFFMMDSNGYGTMSSATASNGHSSSKAGLGADQIAWYQQEIADIKAASPQTKLSFMFHIPIQAFVDALVENGFNNSSNNAYKDFDKDGKESTFGMAYGSLTYPWDTAGTFFNDIKQLGVDSIFTAHHHGYSVGMEYQGVHLQFGLKTGTYDQAIYITSTGGVTFSYNDGGDPVTGGTVIPISRADGSISPYHIVTNIDEDKAFAQALTKQDEDATVTTVHIQTVKVQVASDKKALYLQFIDQDGQIRLISAGAGVSSKADVSLQNLAKQIHYNNQDVLAYKGVITVSDNKTLKISLTQDAPFRRMSYVYIPQDTTYAFDTDGNGKVDTVWTFDRDFKIMYDPTACVVRESLGGCNGDCASGKWHVYAKPLVNSKESVAVSCWYWNAISSSTELGMQFKPAAGQTPVNLGYGAVWLPPDDNTTAFLQYIKINGNTLPTTAKLQLCGQLDSLKLYGVSFAVGDVITVEKGAVFTHNGYTMTVGATLTWTYNGGNSFSCSATE